MVLIVSCHEKTDVVGKYSIEKFNPEAIDNMYVDMHIKNDNTFELSTIDKKNIIIGKWKLKGNNIEFYYEGKIVKGILKDFGGFIVNSPNEFHSGHFSIILYVKSNLK